MRRFRFAKPPDNRGCEVTRSATDGPRSSESVTPLQPAPTHVERVFAIRRELADGTYDIDGRLDSVLEKVLADIASRAEHTEAVGPAKQAVREASVRAQAVEGGLPAPARKASSRRSRRAG
jgi:hypothetical protein